MSLFDARSPAGPEPEAIILPEATPAAAPRPDRPPRRDLMAALRFVLLGVLLLVAGWLRFDSQNWDDFTHLHPDERFLTEVVSLLNGPLVFEARREDPAAQLGRCLERYPATSVGELRAGRGGYFDASCSPLNPNNVGKGFYVYGEFPLFTVRLAGEARNQLSLEVQQALMAFDLDATLSYSPTTHWTGYNGAQFVGRTVAAVADLLTILVLFALGRQLYNGWIGLLAAALYGLAAFPIQQSQFWTVDTFTTLWVTLAIWFAVRALFGVSARQGPPAPAYLALWALGVGWETAYWDRPVLGLLTLSVAFALALAVTATMGALARARGRGWGGGLVAASGVLASVLYLVGWAILNATAANNFALADGLLTLGFTSLLFAVVTLAAYVAAWSVRRQSLLGTASAGSALAVGAVGVTWLALVAALLLDGVAPWPTLLVTLGAAVLLVTDLTELTDYALFGVALGAAVASRVNVAPLAAIIALAALLRALPAVDVGLSPERRARIVGAAIKGVVVAAVVSLLVFRLLNPHAFMGPGLFGLRINPGWWEDLQEAAVQQSGSWDVAPNYQWVDRPAYLFPWRNIVTWGLGLPLGLVAWAAWAWAGVTIVRGRAGWMRHVLPFVWILGYFGWLGGRWVTTMRYFLPLYPILALFGAWGLWSLAGAARRAARAHPTAARRLVYGGAVALVLGVTVFTGLFGYGMHRVHATQLTRVAASRWFQEFVPGDIGVWVEGDDGTRQLVNLGMTYVAPPAQVHHLDTGALHEFTTDPMLVVATPAMGGVPPAPGPLWFPEGAVLEGITFHRLGDPARDAEAETVRARIYYATPGAGRELLYEGTLERDLDGGPSPYGHEIALSPEDEVRFEAAEADAVGAGYVLQISVPEGGPVMFTHGITDDLGIVLADITVTVRLPDGTVAGYEFRMPEQPVLTGYGDDIPITPTQWTPGGRDAIPFSIPIDGEIRTLEIPHLGDVLRDADEESVTVSIETTGGESVTATITGDFNANADPLGAPQTVTFDPPLRVRAFDEAGNRQVATLVVEAQDPVYTSGPVIAWEGAWDDPVPWPVCPLPEDMVYRDDLPSGLSSLSCTANGMYGAHYQGIQLWMVSEDNQQKRDAMLLALDQADYLVITSNRFYDALTRLPMRWPMTTHFYETLFEGDLGFELVRTFESTPSVGPIAIRDQVLPTDDLPAWLNEHWEAEEAYHVYDHPVVFVFRKTSDYTPALARAVLGSVSLRTPSTAGGTFVPDPQPIGVIPWTSLQADASPTALLLDPAQRAIQRAGGTWSDLFEMDSLLNRSQVAAVVVWWLLMIAAGWLAWPLLAVLLPSLPDRAYPAAKLVAWLLVAWVAWAAGSLNILAWSRAGIAVLLLALAAVSGLVIWPRRVEFITYLRAHWRYLLAIEVLSAALFAAMIGVRLGNPDLWHGSFGGEKPMDFAYFNAVLRSTVFPPIDPWHAGGYMNYYYFGYVIVGAPVKLLGIRPALAYNLIIPALYAMTGAGVFSIAYNWVKSHDDDPERAGRPRRWPSLPRGNAWLAGLLAVVLAVVIGNLGTLLEFTRQVAALDGWSPRPPLTEVRRAELETERQAIFDRYYAEEVEDFQAEHGREPSEPGDVVALTQRAQERTNAYIEAEVEHPPLTRVWSYGMRNLREQIGAFFGGVEQLAKGAKLMAPPSNWYWNPTRVINDIPGVGPAIAEMPYFTFLYGDLHAHMLSMPVYLFALLWLLAEVLAAGRGLRRWWEAALALVVGGLAVGVLRPTNSWDWITFLILAPAALTYAAWLGAVRRLGDRPPSRAAARLWGWLHPRRVVILWPALLIVPVAVIARVGYYLVRHSQALEQAGRMLQPGETPIEATLTPASILLWIAGGLALVALAYAAALVMLRAYIDKPTLLAWLGRIALFFAAAAVAALPFTRTFNTAYTSVQPWEGGRTPLWAYLYVHGLFLLIVGGFLLWQTGRVLRRFRVRDLQGLAVPVGLGALVVAGGMLLSLVIGARELPALQVAGPLLIWAVALFLVPGQHPYVRMLYPLIVLALAITIGTEVIVLSGDIGRQNTVFKFYLQVWFFFSVVSAVALAWMLPASARWWRPLRYGWQVALGALLTIGLLYPILGTQGRWMNRFNAEDTPLTLDGMDYMPHAIHGENGVWFSLGDDYRLIRWLQEHVEGTPVIMEGHAFPSEYKWNARVSIYTGLPTVLGWRFHQVQQHSLPQLDQVIVTRENNIAAFYGLTGRDGIEAAWRLIDAYNIEYVVVGVLERVYYGDILIDPETGLPTAGHSPALAKFEDMVEMGLLARVYEEPGCLAFDVEECPVESVYMNTIYRVVPGAELGEPVAARGPAG